MLGKQLIDKKFLKLIFAGFISYYFGLMVLQYKFKAVFLLGLALFVIVFLIRIEYAFYFLLVSRSLVDIFFRVEGAETSLGVLIGGLISLLFIYYTIVVSKYKFFSLLSLGINKIYGIFLLSSIPAIFMSESFMYGFGVWFRLFQGFLVLNITILLLLDAGSELYKKRINIICWSVILAILIPYILYLNSYIQGTYVVGTGKLIRYGAFFVTYNVFAYHLLAVLPFCLFLYSLTIRNSKKIPWLIFIAITIFIIYVSYTRTVWLGLATLLFTWNIFRKNFNISFSILILISLLIIFSPTVQDRLQDIYLILTSGSFFYIDPKLGSGRIGIFQDTIRYFINESALIEKFFGNGFGISSKVTMTRGTRTAIEHNNYLILLMNVGICGLFAYLLYLLKLFQESFKLLRGTQEIYLRNLAQIFIPVLLSYIVIGITSHTLYKITFQYYFSVFAGFVVAANMLEKNRTKEKNQTLIKRTAKIA